ncbi:hypothetical protein EVAR_16054_1 [Eumeta japonica]|uniref:Uncharacterized protein n=1 Tax=Eumeta variegata TaxID=151549 RepID=A0A4C1VZ04_EUMVA|nr:hypothetical protein EVAR_16054_1 [Eumeta japonica]
MDNVTDKAEKHENRTSQTDRHSSRTSKLRLQREGHVDLTTDDSWGRKVFEWPMTNWMSLTGGGGDGPTDDPVKVAGHRCLPVYRDRLYRAGIPS